MNYSNEEIVDTFLNYIDYFSIAHHVPGRIRIKASLFKAKQLKDANTDDLEEVISRIPGIRGYRVNEKALSAVIEYDPALLAFELWEEAASVGAFPLKRDGVREKLLALLA